MASGALFVFIVLLYWPAVDFRLIGIDDSFYAMNPVVTGGLDPVNIRHLFSTIPGGDLFLPVTRLSFMADVSLFGVSPRGFHLTNILLHAASMGLLLLVLRRMTGSLWRSALAAALVGLHPLRVESVAWVAERKDVLSVFFLVLTLACYANYARGGRLAWFGATLVASVLGMLSKPTLVTLPALLLLLDFWPLGRFRAAFEAPLPERRRRVLNLALEKAPFLALSLFQAGMTIHLQGKGGLRPGIGLLSRVEHALAAVLVYLGQTFWPADLSLRFFDIPWARYSGTLLPVAAAVALTTAVVLRFALRQPWLAAGWFWYLAALLPVSGIVPSGFQWLSDRYTYVPHIGLMVGLVWTTCAIPARVPRAILVGLLALALIPLAASTRRQLFYWRDGSTLLGKGIAASSGDMVYVDKYVEELLLEGKLAEARAELDRHRDRLLDPTWGIEIQDRYLTLAERAEGRVGAIAKAREFLAADSRFFRTRLRLAEFLSEERRYAEAIPEYETVLAVPVLRPTDRAYALEGLGIALRGQGKEAEALARFLEGIAVDPARSRLHYQLGELLAARGELAAARDHYAEALRLEPENPLIRLGLADLLMAGGEAADAGALLREVASRQPGSGEGLYAQGRLQEAQGDRAAALASYEAALRAPAQWPELRAVVLKRLGRPSSP
jgi:tetratricopeptide (TPR) repeat protein